MSRPADPSGGMAGNLPFSANIGRRTPSTVFVHGEVDMATAPTLADSVRAVIDQKLDKLTLDFADMTFMGGAGLSVIAYTLRQSPDGFKVVLRHPRPITRNVLELMGMEGPCVIED